MVQTLPPHAPKEPLAHGIHQGRTIRNPYVVDADGPGCLGKERSVCHLVRFLDLRHSR